MTAVSFANESERLCVDVPSLDELSSNTGSRRFNLKKRTHDENKVNISSYNSAFLSGLFADVARVAEVETPVTPEESTEATPSLEEEARLDHNLSVKRSRVSLTKSFSRCGRSYKNLTEVSSPVGVDTFPAIADTSNDACIKFLKPSCSPSMQRMDSLHFQLGCVNPTVSPTSVKAVVDIIDMAFPHLPATVSDSSCSHKQQQQDLTLLSDQPASVTETTSTNSCPKECYGWFVALDEDEDCGEDTPAADPYTRTSSSLDLAFTASTAPKRVSNYDAEVEWAKAADTVDDVLGDFF